MGVSWIYRLSKEQLKQELRDIGTGTDGTVVQLRQRLVAYVRRNPEAFAGKPEDAPGYKEEVDRTRDLEEFHDELVTGLGGDNASTPLRPTAPSSLETSLPAATVLDQMRKWNCHFDGRDPYAFIERIRELQGAYRLSDQQVLQGFPELLRGDALLWYRNMAPSISSWEELEEQLRRYYLPPGELRHLDRQIADRYQGPAEPVRNYVTALMTLIRRRGGYDRERQLDTLYHNLQPELQLHIRRTELTDATSLIQRVEEVEEILRRVHRGARSAPPPREPSRRPALAITSAYQRATHCWRCKKPGHDRFTCTNAAVRFCSFCGQDGVLTKDCPCHVRPNTPGNEPRAGLP